MESDGSVINRHHGMVTPWTMLGRRISFVYLREHPVLANFRELEVCMVKPELKLIALDHCGAEITVELHPLARETQKAKEAVKLTGGFLGLKWTAASKTSLKSSLCFCLHFLSLTLTTAATERTPSTLH